MTRFLMAAALAAVTLAPSMTHAATNYAPANAICSGDFSAQISSGVSLSCMGDLWLSGGEISSNTDLSIFSLGSLSLDNIRLVGTSISLKTLASGITVSDTVIFNTVSGEQPVVTLSNLFTLYMPPMVAVDSSHPGYGSLASTMVFTEISPVDAVPEPATWALSLLGLAMMGAIVRRR